MNLSVVVGPPGCGKTSYVARQAKRAVEKYGREQVLLLSLTRSAASEIRSRGIDIPDEHVGTLHSLCFHLLGRPKILKKANLDEWNLENPYWSVDVSFSEDKPEERGSGWYEEVELRRHRRTTTLEDSRFLDAWRLWQTENQVSEFTHLIEACLQRQILFHPQPAVIFVDETQDLSDLELALIYRWAEGAEHLVLVGDPAQSIYGWRGASRLAMPEPTVLLRQSYRVPRAPWEHARGVLEMPVTMTPRDHEGTLESGPSRREMRYYIDRMADVGGTWMFLAPCQFMADQIAKDLRLDGVTYWNPFDTRRWNPLRGSTRRGVSTADRVRAFGGDWTTANVRRWKPLFAGVFTRGSDRVFDLLADDDPPRAVHGALMEVTKPEHQGWLGDLDPSEAQGHLAAAYKKADFALELLGRGGRAALDKTPQAIVGTIHSVKGGEADHVVVFPDLSPRQWDQLQEPGWDGSGAVRRMFYVGMTRARESLILGNPSGGHHL